MELDMSTQTREVNKSAAVREALGKNPNSPVKEIVSALAAQGIKVSDNLVYGIKSQMKSKKGSQKHHQAPKAIRTEVVVNPVVLIREVKKLANQAGGLGHLKQLVDVLAE
jgi:hypothetical protein